VLCLCDTSLRRREQAVLRLGGKKVFRSNIGEDQMKWIGVALLGAATSCATGAVPSKTTATSIASPRSAVASYHTFSFGLADQPETGYEVTPRSLEVQRRLRPVVLQALLGRGYVEDRNQSDFIVKLAAGTGELPNPAAERAVPTGLARGFIGIDVYDGSTGTEVWKGSAFAEIDPEKIDDSLLEMGVNHMLADFPSRDTSGIAKNP
jgi:hypothetical protein